MPKMKDADLRDLVAKRRDASFKHVTGSLSRDRRDALKMYRGDNDSWYGDSGDGLSTIVSRDTMEAIESMLPSLIKPFVAGDETVRFEPHGPEDEDGAKQATEYINYLFHNHNDSFRVIYDSVKDALIYRFGCAKVVFEEAQETTFERYQGLIEVQIEELEKDAELTIVGDVEDNGDGTFNARVSRTSKRGMYRVYVVPPEQFMYEARIADLGDATFLGHHSEKPVGDLIAMGLPKDKCKDLKPGTPSSMSDDDRFVGQDEFGENLNDDDPARRVWVDECYIRCDYEGDGTLVWRKVILGGNDNTVLLDEECDDHPFVGWTPIPEPHKLLGQSIADLVRDIQLASTAIKREMQNATYLSNRPMREVVEGQVNIDDLFSPSVGGVVRVKAPGQIREINNGGDGIVQTSLALIESLTADRETRTGVTRYNQGTDANSLNHTATGVSIITNAAQQRQELVARNYAEGFLRPLFKKMLKLVSRYQDKAEVIRLRGQWVQIDPSEWRTGYDMSVAVGLGTGNKQEMVGQLTTLLQIQREVAEGQGGMTGPLVDWEKVHETLTRLTEAMGLKGVERYFGDPAAEAEQGQQPEADPAAAQQQAEQAQAQAEQQKHAAELEQKHATAVEVAHIDAAAKIEVAKISAEQAIIVAGMQVPANIMPEGEQETAPEPVREGDDMPPMQAPQAQDAMPQIHPALLAQLMGEQPGEAPEAPEYDIDPSMGG